MFSNVFITRVKEDPALIRMHQKFTFDLIVTKECFYKHGGICLVIVVYEVEPAAMFSKLRHGGAFGEAQTMSHKRQKWPLSD